MQEEKYPFIMDIGTDAGDFTPRYNAVAKACGKDGFIPDFIHFSAGLWPGRAAIEHQAEALQKLEADIQAILKSGQLYTAVGECGIDRYWNHAGATGTGTDNLAGEETLFKEQLALAKRYGLALIIHSRDGFEPTLRCIDEVGWHRGVIHCFSYGKKEAEAFLERGWYLSFPGTITYTDNAETASAIAELVRMAPDDKLLLETDAPYLSPQPVRREVNTPLNIPYTYQAASKYRHCSIEHLCEIVYRNSRRLFSVLCKTPDIRVRSV
jgi:hydrolase, tatD family